MRVSRGEEEIPHRKNWKAAWYKIWLHFIAMIFCESVKAEFQNLVYFI